MSEHHQPPGSPLPDFPASLSSTHPGDVDLRQRMHDLPATGEPEAVAADSPVMGYAASWLVDEDLDALNRRIHDGAPLDKLLDRGRAYRDWLFTTFPEAAPATDGPVLELGSGVGWIMEAMLERFSCREIVGLDISANMIARGRERLSDPRARFVLYDGFHIPFEDGHFPVIYSVAAMQHIEKHVAFLLFEELYRVLEPGGHAVIHLLSVDHIPGTVPSYHDECWNHVLNRPEHWHHYYAFDELFVLFSEVIGVSDLDVVHDPNSNSFLVHFGKGGAERWRRPDLPGLRYTARLIPDPAPEPAPALAPEPAPGPRPLAYAVADRLPAPVRAKLGRWKRRLVG